MAKSINASTIVAVATPLSSEGAIGIIRLSGEKAIKYAEEVFISKNGKKLSEYSPQRMVYGNIVFQNKVYDEVMAVYFKSPFSYTTEDVVEIQCHGNIASLIKINSLFISLGASPAERGEFTKRAFLGGRIDLSQAESVMDMVSAKTPKGFSVALNGLRGGITKEVRLLTETLTDLLAKIEVCIDYPDEDIENIERNEISEILNTSLIKLDEFEKSFQRGSLLKEGVSMAIIGVPNVGKSSLMNYLLREERAIVTDVPGTTRDILKEWVNIGGIPVHLIDTAGIRDTEDVVEKIGVEKSKEIFNEADIVIMVLSACEEITEFEKEILEMADKKKSIIILNKIDLKQKIKIKDIKKISRNSEVLEISIKEKKGLKSIEDKFLDIVSGGNFFSKDSDFVINQRQFFSIVRAKNSIKTAYEAIEKQMPLDLLEIDLINAYDALGEITGQTVDEDVINRIFEKFCLGK